MDSPKHKKIAMMPFALLKDPAFGKPLSKFGGFFFAQPLFLPGHCCRNPANALFLSLEGNYVGLFVACLEFHQSGEYTGCRLADIHFLSIFPQQSYVLLLLLPPLQSSNHPFLLLFDENSGAPSSSAWRNVL